MGIEYKAGLLCGMLAGVIVGLLFVVLMKHKKVIDCHFDERQERSRGKAFKYGFFTLAVLTCLYGALDTIIGVPCDTLAGTFLCFAAAMTVFAAVCIREDAYLSLFEKPKKVMALFAGLSAFNLAVCAGYFLDGTMVEEGVLTFRVCNLAVGVMLLVIMGIYAVHLRRQRGEEAE